MSQRVKVLVLVAAAVAGVIAALALVPALREASFWQAFVEPGPLSPGHRFLEGNCAGCHQPVEGVGAARCISCHANETALLQRQPTAFHASIGTCVECHREHEPDAQLRSVMNHEAFAAIGLRQLASAPADSDARLLFTHLSVHGPADSSGSNERMLDCFACHQSRDRHAGQFGRECSECHQTTQWTIAEYRHPPPSSTDCVQCHRAPPSHYMGHFEMVSKRVAGVEHASVSECYLCHQTTSWNDIRAVGMYDHH